MGHAPRIDNDRGADRIRSLIFLRAACETVLARLDEDDIDDLTLTVQITELCDALGDELARFARRDPTRGGPSP